jgi:hypothetical protein
VQLECVWCVGECVWCLFLPPLRLKTMPTCLGGWSVCVCGLCDVQQCFVLHLYVHALGSCAYPNTHTHRSVENVTNAKEGAKFIGGATEFAAFIKPLFAKQ